MNTNIINSYSSSNILEITNEEDETFRYNDEKDFKKEALKVINYAKNLTIGALTNKNNETNDFNLKVEFKDNYNRYNNTNEYCKLDNNSKLYNNITNNSFGCSDKESIYSSQNKKNIQDTQRICSVEFVNEKSDNVVNDFKILNNKSNKVNNFDCIEDSKFIYIVYIIKLTIFIKKIIITILKVLIAIIIIIIIAQVVLKYLKK